MLAPVTVEGAKQGRGAADESQVEADVVLAQRFPAFADKDEGSRFKSWQAHQPFPQLMAISVASCRLPCQSRPSMLW
jgi:hypothetical protein